MKNYKLLLWINQSNGDTLGIIPLVQALVEQYPDLDVKLACYYDQAYLLEHLPVEIVPVQGNYRNMAMRTVPSYFLDKVRHIIDQNYTPIHLWGGLYNHKHTWQCQVKTFNNQCQENNIDIVLDDSKFGYIELPLKDIHVEKNAIYVESCQPVSGQTNFQFDLYKMSLMFPNVNYYTVGPVNFQAKNIFDCSKMSLIDLSNISRKCKLILAKGSGPFFCTLCEENKNKTKALMGLTGGWKYKFWNEDDDNCLLLDTEKEMMDLIRPINRGAI